MPYQVHAMPRDVADRVRASRADALGRPAVWMIADGPGYPCRDSLRDAAPGAPVILFGYGPPGAAGPYAEIGPVVIAAEPGDAAEVRDRLPEMIRGRPLITARAYDAAGRIRDARVAPGAEIEGPMNALLAHPDTAEVHLRNAGWGCFLCRVTRA